jgi:DNA-binding transcriptional ArsR family regulator
MNMKIKSVEKMTGELFSVLGNPFRIRLLLTIENGEACVCHLEAVLKKRQAFISQHLMALREAGLLETRRDGKYVFYRLANPAIIHLVKEAAKIAGIDKGDTLAASNLTVSGKCPCPHCTEMETEIAETQKTMDAASSA